VHEGNVADSATLLPEVQRLRERFGVEQLVMIGDRGMISSKAIAELHELPRGERCCGFGGAFSVRYPDVSTAMADDKLASVAVSGVETVVSADPGCIMQIEGRAERTGAPVAVIHLATLLAEAL